MHKVECELGGRPLQLQTGLVAKQANGSVWVKYGETIVLVTACSKASVEPRGFLPLSVEYREKAYAGGRIPGNFHKREGRPHERETLNMRLVDHQIRPLFAKGFSDEVQVYISVLSHDGENDADLLAMVGASAALCLSDIPFAGPVGAVRIGRIDGEWMLNPTHTQLLACDVDLVVSGTGDSISSVEGGGKEVDEAAIVAALELARGPIAALVALQNELVGFAGKDKIERPSVAMDEKLAAAVEERAVAQVAVANRTADKEERAALLAELRVRLGEELNAEESVIDANLHALIRRDLRAMVLCEKKRIDGRRLDEVRRLDCAVTPLPRAHGSALFTRGRTQVLCAATLGTRADERMQDDLCGKRFKTFFLDYNFPPFSVGEVGPVRGPGRREIGHGLLAERALVPVLPTREEFPYSVRLVAEVTESDSSSSLAAVCGSSLALMDAGVPIRKAVCGVGVGLVKEGDDWELLTDIQSAEDFLGDMDLKVAGTKDGITAIQMDVKIRDLDLGIITAALERARVGRLHVLATMQCCLAAPRADLSPHAPRLDLMAIDPAKIGAVIGPGGKTIRQIEAHGVRLDIGEDGSITLSYQDPEVGEKAKQMIMGLTTGPEVGRVYRGTVKSIKPFGAFIEILPGKDGLCHISEFSHGHVERVEDVVALGDEIAVEVVAIDAGGKIRLSHKMTSEKSERREAD